MRYLAWLLIVVASALAAPPAVAAVKAPGGVAASVRTTAHGIPHVIAGDYRSLGYGYGWALAHDALCPLAEAYVTVSAERSRFFGPEGSYDQSTSTGTTPNNLESDFFFAKVIKQRTVERLLDPAHPGAPGKQMRELVEGYVQGYNAALRDQKAPDGIDDPTCKGKAWVRPISEIDAWRRFYQLVLFPSSNFAMKGIVEAAPPAGGLSPARARATQAEAIEKAGDGRFERPLGLGSNGIAFGGDLTSDGHGLLLGNPHFPWHGPERFYTAHLTIPDKLDVAGSSILGVPLMTNGFTRNMAWFTPTSTARRFVPYQLTLAPGDPTAYVVDGEVRKMRRTDVTVQARQADGSLAPRSHTFYDSEYGPMLTSLAGLPIFPWNAATAYTIFDANAEVLGRVARHFFDVNHAQSVAELDQISRRHQGLPFVNQVATDTGGTAYFSDIGNIPNVDREKYSGCNTPPGQLLDSQARLPILDGSRSDCAPGTAPGAAAPGILPPSREPSLTRRDYVENSNDSHWLVNPRQPLEGFSRIIGDERTARAFRTRVGMLMVEQGGGGWTPERLMDLVFSNRNYAGELFRDDLVALCRSRPVLPGSNGPVDVSEACPALEAWDLRDNLDSRGGFVMWRLMRRIFIDGYSNNWWRVPFNVQDPLNTPRGLNTEDVGVQRALADAVSDVRGTGLPFDAPVRDYQYVVRGGERIPIHGAPHGSNFNLIIGIFDPKRGYPEIQHGSSYHQVVRLTGGCPEAYTVQSYSQSPDLTSPFYADQTRMFSEKRWFRLPFCEREIASDRALRVTDIGGGFPGASARLKLIRSLEVRRVSRGRLVAKVRLRSKGSAVVKVRSGGKTVRRAKGRGKRVVLRFRGVPRGKIAVRVVATVGGKSQGVTRALKGVPRSR